MWKKVEEQFVRTGQILHLHVNGQLLRTTPEHPFWVYNKGWTPAGELQPGDWLSSHDGKRVAVEEVFDTREFETVHNLRVADFHTYFVGSNDWGFSVWAHNEYQRKLVTSADEVPTHASGKFDAWFDSLSARTVKKLYKNPEIRAKVEQQLRGSGGDHEYLKVADAPEWKKWGVTMEEFRKATIPISELNEGGVAKGWKHSTGLKGSEAPNSSTVHNELADIIYSSNSLADFRSNLRPWAEQWLSNGVNSLPANLR